MAVQPVARAAVIVTPDFSKFESTVKGFAGRAGGMMSALTTVVTGAGLAGMVAFGIKSAASLEQAQVGFSTMLGSGKKAQAFLGQLQKFAAATPFELKGLIDSSRTLLGVGVNAKQVIPLLTAFGDTAGAVGVGQEAFQRIILATSQAISAGKFQQGDLNQIMTNGIPIYTILSKAMGKPVTAIRQLASHGKLLASDVLPALQKEMEKDYGGAMAKQSQTLAGVWSTLTDTVSIGLANAIKPLVPLMETFVPKAANVMSAALTGLTGLITAFAAGLNLRGDPRATGFTGFLDVAGRGLRAFSDVLRGEGTSGSKGFVGAMEKIAQSIRDAMPYVQGLGGEAVTLSRYLKQNADTVRDVAQVVSVAATAYLGYRGALYAVEIATKAVAAAQKVWAAVQGAIAFVQLASQVRSVSEAWVLLDAAMDANPIGVVVAAIVVLVGALYLAWTHSATFRKIVIGAWDGIKVAVSATVNWFVHTVWPWLQSVWDNISAGAVNLWHALTSAWNAVRGAVAAVLGWFTGTLWPTMRAIWNGIVTDVTNLYHRFDPLWSLIAGAVKIASAIIQLAMAIVMTYVRGVFIPMFQALWQLVKVVWNGISGAVSASVSAVRAALSNATTFIRGVFAAAFTWLWHNIIQPIWAGITGTISKAVAQAKAIFTGLVTVVRSTLGPVFTALWHNVISPAFNGIRGAISSAWDFIRPILSAFSGFVKNQLVSSFHIAVAAIKSAWGGLKAAAKAPVVFVVDSVINPLIGGFNNLAKIFHTPQIAKIPGFAEGGRIPGAPSSSDNRLGWLKNAAGKQIGNIAVATGEFIVNARDTAKALPLLNWINDGMKGGPTEATRRIGRPLTDMPGDGSEGWAFANGGLVGFLSDVWGALSDPAKAIKAPIERMIGRIPGGGEIKSVLAGMGHKLVDGFVHWATTFGGTGAGSGNVLAAQNFVRAQAGKPYIWASAGPQGYDCSGIVSAVYNVFKGKNPYSHTFSTESLPGSWFRPGRAGPLVAGWSHPGQAPASASVGHMAGNIGGLPFESIGSRGVRIGFNARKVTEFANLGVARAAGGLVELAKTARADFGLSQITAADTGRVTLRPGWNMVKNGTGAAEALSTAGGDIHIHFHDSIVTSKQQAEDMVVAAIQSARKKRRIS
jgi:tape measure domain-containing protein